MSDYHYIPRLTVDELELGSRPLRIATVENQLTVGSATQLSSLTLRAIGGSSSTTQLVHQPWAQSTPVCVQSCVDSAFSGSLITSMKPFGNSGNSPRQNVSIQNVNGLSLGNPALPPESTLDCRGVMTHQGLRERRVADGQLGDIIRELSWSFAASSNEDQVQDLNARLQTIGMTGSTPLRQFRGLMYWLTRNDGDGIINGYDYDNSVQHRYKLQVDSGQVRLYLKKRAGDVDVTVHVRSYWSM